MRLISHDSCDVALARKIICKHDISTAKPPHRAVSAFDIPLPRKRNNKLAARGGMPVYDMPCRDATENRHRSRMGSCRMELVFTFKRQLYFLEMRLLIRTREDSNNVHK